MAPLSLPDNQSEQPALMPPSHPDTAAQDPDVCVTCDGECTCNYSSDKLPVFSPPVPTTSAPLKIKLTVPPGLLLRARPKHSPLASASTSSVTPAGATKKRIQPPKQVAMPHVPQSCPRSQFQTKSISQRKNSGTRGSTLKSSRRKHIMKGSVDYYPAVSGSSSGRRMPSVTDVDDDGDQIRSTYSPFISAPVHMLSSVSSSTSCGSSNSGDSSDSDELSDFSDSSIVREEESYIQVDELQRRAHAHDKARLRRELLGDNVPPSTHRSAWEIRPRQRSVGASADEMNVDNVDSDSDSDVEDGEEEAGGAGDDEDDENDGDDGDDEDENGTSQACTRRGTYVGIATGWSEDDDEGFDAEVFFASLEDSDSGAEHATPTDCDADITLPSDEDDTLEFTTHSMFEVTEGWDGSIMFTNGFGDGQGLLDREFEASARLLATSSSGESEGEEADEEDGEDEDVQMAWSDTGGEEEMDSDAGNSTDVELVDSRGLPTERLMRLFRPPTIPPVSIDPKSTMSPLRPRGHMWEEGDAEEGDRSTSPAIKRRPTMGTFETPKRDAFRRAVIDGSCGSVNSPSPFPPRSHRRIMSDSSSMRTGRHRSHSLSLSHSLVLSPGSCDDQLPFPPSDDWAPSTPSLPSAQPIALDDVLDASLLDSDPFVEAQSQVQPQPDTEMSFMSDAHDNTSSTMGQSTRHMQNLLRWDRIPMSTFRHTRESGLINDSGTSLHTGMSVIRDSPFSALALEQQQQNQGKQKQRQYPRPIPSLSVMENSKDLRKATRRARRATLESVFLSPVLLPVRDRDGERTPPNHPPQVQSHMHSRRAGRRDKMLSHAPPRRAQQRQHKHGHHPNSKSRASGSSQRSFTSVPPLSI